MSVEFKIRRRFFAFCLPKATGIVLTLLILSPLMSRTSKIALVKILVKMNKKVCCHGTSIN